MMTKPSPEVLENEKDKLFVTDAGVPEKSARALMLDRKRDSGFSKRSRPMTTQNKRGVICGAFGLRYFLYNYIKCLIGELAEVSCQPH
jgi:hypothetical protein